jgi:pimeloyl-ACP methyl ester carboxylesterase
MPSAHGSALAPEMLRSVLNAIDVPMIRGRMLRRVRRRDPWSGLSARESLTDVGEFRIHSVEFGAGGQAVVLLHGLAGSARWWRRNVAALREEYTVVIPDLIGFGRSPRAGRLPDISRVAAVMHSWLHTLGLGRVHVVGHSMGGQISVHLAAAFPEVVDRLVLVDSAGIPHPMTPREFARACASLAPPRAWGDPRFLRTIAGDAWVAGPVTMAQAVGHIVRDDVRPLLPGVMAPTLVIWGERDRLVPPDDADVFRRLIPDASLVRISGAAHNPMVDRPGAFNRLVLRFLRGEPVGW